jgi:hypothetical protein
MNVMSKHIAYEEAYAAAMRALAKKEGRVGLLPRNRGANKRRTSARRNGRARTPFGL